MSAVYFSYAVFINVVVCVNSHYKSQPEYETPLVTLYGPDISHDVEFTLDMETELQYRIVTMPIKFIQTSKAAFAVLTKRLLPNLMGNNFISDSADFL